MIQIKGKGQSEAAGYMQQALAGGKKGGGVKEMANEMAKNIMRDPVARKKMAEKMGIAPPRRQKSSKKYAISDDDDSDFDFDDDDDEQVAAIRATMLKKMQKVKIMRKKFHEYEHLGHGQYSTLNQDEFLPAVTKSKYCLAHFSHPEFERCRILDKHLSHLAKIHINTRIIKIDSTKAPFFVTKLAVQVLPTLIFLEDGKVIHRMVGFEGLGGKDDFKTSDLEKYIKENGLFRDRKNVSEDESSDNDEGDVCRSRYIRRTKR